MVGSDDSYKAIRMVLGPLAVLGLPVWVNTQYAQTIKMQNDRETFRFWIKPFTAHNEKLGLNSSQLQMAFTKSGKVSVPTQSKYREFAQAAQKIRNWQDQ